MRAEKLEKIKNLAEKYALSLIYLFGSQANEGYAYLTDEKIIAGDAPDLDIGVWLIKIPDEPVFAYGDLFREFSKVFDPFAVDLVFLHEVETLIQYEIICGKRIYEKDESYADEVEEKIMKLAEDLNFKKIVMEKDTMEAIRDGYFEFEYSPNS